MRPFLPLVLLLAVGCGPSAETPEPVAAEPPPTTEPGTETETAPPFEVKLLSTDDFTLLFATRLRELLPDATVTVDGELQCTASRVDEQGDGPVSIAYLDNAYAAYLADPTQFDAVLGRFAQASASRFERAGQDAKLDELVVVLKDAAYLDDLARTLRERMPDATDVPMPYHEPLNDDLIVLYARDTPTSLSYLLPEDIEKLELTREALRDLAVDNLSERLPEIERHGGEGLYMLTAGGNYEATLLLVDWVWTTETFPVDGEFVAAVPARDVLLVTGSNDTAGLERLRSLATSTLSEASYTLTDTLFVRRDGSWVPFDDE